MIRLTLLLVALAGIVGGGPASASVLYAVTGESGGTPETLYTLSLVDASATLESSLGNGTDGEEIAFNPNDGLIYHFSGIGGINDPDMQILETIDPDTLAVANVVLKDSIGGEANSTEVKGFTHLAASTFLAADIQFEFHSVQVDGTVTFLGGMDHLAKGLAFRDGTLWSLDRDGSNLRVIDPANGSTISGPVSVTLPGFTIDKGISLATDPETNILYAVLKTETSRPGDRVLTTLDPDTGVAALVGQLGIAVASIAFVPEPSSLALGVTALASLGWVRCCSR